jgi:hypothetical protein
MFVARVRIDVRIDPKEPRVRRILTTTAVFAVVALAQAPSALAKGSITDLTVCGRDGCKSVPIPMRLIGMHALDRLLGAPEAPAEPAPGPFYRLRLEIVHGGRISVFYLPGGTIVRDSSWQTLGAGMASDLAEATYGIRPYVPTLTGVRVDGRRVRDAGAYTRLLGPLPRAGSGTTVDVTRGVGIELRTATPTPWGRQGDIFGVYDPKTGLVDVAGGPRVPTAALRDAIERDAGLPSPGGGRTAVMWAGGAAALASVGLVMVRRRRRGGNERAG